MLSSHYKGGRASALEIRRTDEFFAHYVDQQNVQLEPAITSMRKCGPAQRNGLKLSVDCLAEQGLKDLAKIWTLGGLRPCTTKSMIKKQTSRPLLAWEINGA